MKSGVIKRPVADVYQGDKLVAHLSRSKIGASLGFLPDVDLDRSMLATTLRFQSEPIESQFLHTFFLNLLPEGARLRLLLEASRSKDDVLGLIVKLGWDTIGDVAILPHGEAFEGHEVSVRPSKLANVNFWELFHQGIAQTVDATVPGVQEKISSSTIAFGVRTESIPSAILKLNPTQYPLLVQNEAFFLKMAKACEIEVNNAILVQDRDQNWGLLVDRFDRVKVGKSIKKLHQEDACQLLDLPPGQKYDVSFREIADVVEKTCDASIVEIERLIRLYAFSYIIGNCDLHAKNISVLWRHAVRLSPGYDLLSTLPYPLDRHMALSLDGKNDNFRAGHFMEFGQRYGVSPNAMRAALNRLCEKARPWIDRFPEIGFEAKATAQLQSEIARRLKHIAI